MDLNEAIDNLRAAQERHDGLLAEVRDLDQRIMKEGSSPQLKERLGNLLTGTKRAGEDVVRLQKEAGAIAEGAVASGAVHAEPGDSRKSSSTSFDTKGFGGELSPMTQALRDGRFDLKANPSVTASAFDMLKASTFPAVTDLPRRAGGIVASGQDNRFLYPYLPAQNSGTDLVVQDYRQTARTLTGTVKRAVDATTDKATLDVTLASVVEAISQFAVIIPDIPNALFDSVPQLSTFLGTEGQFQVNKAIDDHVMAQIVAATPLFGQTGSTLIEKVRNGIATMRATGANPSILVVNPTDSAALDLSTDAGGLVFPTSSTGTSSPLWNLRVIERIGAGTEAPYLIDPAMLGVLYLGRVSFDADPFTGFKKNLTNLRVEVNGLFHIRNINGARRIAAA